MDSITYTQAKRNLGAAMDRAERDRAPVLIMRRRGENVVLVSAQEWAGTEEILQWSTPARTYRLQERALGTVRLHAYAPDMTRLSVSLSDQLKDWAESRVAQGRYTDTSDYVRDLMRRDQEREAQLERLLAAVDEGLASPEVETTIEDIIAERRQAQPAE